MQQPCWCMWGIAVSFTACRRSCHVIEAFECFVISCTYLSKHGVRCVPANVPPPDVSVHWCFSVISLCRA
jgi:hypothetical protein